MQAALFIGKRDPVIDVFRGFAITLMVHGHVTDLPVVVHKFIYSFHISAFFIITGYLFNDREARENPRLAVMRKFFRLVVPA